MNEALQTANVFSTDRHQILDDVHVWEWVDLDGLAEIRVNVTGAEKRW